MRLLLNGKVPTKDELLGDELILQMIDEAKAQGVTKEQVIQALTAEDVPETVKQALLAGGVTKESVIQALKAEDIPEAIKKEIQDGVTIMPPVIQKFAEGFVAAMKQDQGKGTTTATDDDKKSALQSIKADRIHI